MKIDRTSLRLPNDQYHAQEREKDLIVIHHTVSCSAAAAVAGWKSDPRRIGTAFIVERDGRVFEVFPPEYWASHVGLQGFPYLESRSIGIELVGEGPLEETESGYRAFGRPYDGEVVTCDPEWRGVRHFAAYTPAQADATAELVWSLVEAHWIPRRLMAGADPRSFDAALGPRVDGVVGHAHLRPDKTDPHPGFPWGLIAAALDLPAPA